MQLYECWDCGSIFKEDDIVYEEEYRGECWGQPAYERMSYCPCCHSDSFGEYYEDPLKLYQCKSCGKIFTVDELHKDIDEDGYEVLISYSCPDCLDEVKEYIE